MVERWSTFHQKHHSTAFRSSCENKKLYGREPNITNRYSCHISTQSLERQRHGRCSVRRIFGCIFRPHRTNSNSALDKYTKRPSPTGVWNGPESSRFIYSPRKSRPRQGNLQFSIRPQWRSRDFAARKSPAVFSRPPSWYHKLILYIGCAEKQTLIQPSVCNLFLENYLWYLFQVENQPKCSYMYHMTSVCVNHYIDSHPPC